MPHTHSPYVGHSPKLPFWVGDTFHAVHSSMQLLLSWTMPHSKPQVYQCNWIERFQTGSYKWAQKVISKLAPTTLPP